MQLARFTDIELLDIMRAIGIAMAADTAGKNQQKRWQELYDRFEQAINETPRHHP
jgi:hypothetical protein